MCHSNKQTNKHYSLVTKFYLIDSEIRLNRDNSTVKYNNLIYFN